MAEMNLTAYYNDRAAGYIAAQIVRAHVVNGTFDVRKLCGSIPADYKRRNAEELVKTMTPLLPPEIWENWEAARKARGVEGYSPEALIKPVLGQLKNIESFSNLDPVDPKDPDGGLRASWILIHSGRGFLFRTTESHPHEHDADPYPWPR